MGGCFTIESDNSRISEKKEVRSSANWTAQQKLDWVNEQRERITNPIAKMRFEQYLIDERILEDINNQFKIEKILPRGMQIAGYQNLTSDEKKDLLEQNLEEFEYSSKQLIRNEWEKQGVYALIDANEGNKEEVVHNPQIMVDNSSVKSSGSSISGFIAVLEFEGNNISSGEVRALTDRLRTELVGTGELTIIERGKMEEVLKEQSFQQTGCISSECAVEVGKLLGVEQIISGNISKVGNYFSVTARVVSVTTGEIVRSTIYDHSGDIGGLLTQGMRKVAEELGK